MTREEARDLFSAAYEDELEPEIKADFEALLASDTELKEQYAQFQELMQATRKLGTNGTSPDVLNRVQRRLRYRSRGRFYRDRFSEQRGRQLHLIFMSASLSLLVILLAWMASRL